MLELDNGSIDIIHNGTAGYGFGNSANEVKRFQTFVASPHCTGTYQVAVKLRRIAGPSFDSPHVELYATSNGKPTGAPLASGQPTVFASGELNPILATFGIASGWLNSSGLLPGATYAIVLSAPTPNSRYEWAVASVYNDLRFGKWDGSSWVDESGLGNGWLQVGVLNADDVIDVTHHGTSGYTFGETHDQIGRFQTFLARADQPIVGLDVKLRKSTGTTHSDIVAELYATSGHKPTGSPLAAAAIASASVGTDWTIVSAPLYYSALSLEHEYAILLSQRTPGPATYEWAVAPTNSVTFFGKWNGSAWVDESALGNGWLKVWAMPSRYLTLDVIHSGLQGNGFGNSTGEIKRYQTFSLSRAATIIGTDLKLRKYNGSTQSNVVAELYATTGNRPSGSPLASGTLSAFHIGSDWTIAHIPLKSHGIAPGTFAIVLSQRVPSPAHYQWAVAQVSGKTGFGKWNGTSWVDESALGDGWTRVWTTDADSDVDVAQSATTGYGFGDSVDEIKRFQTFIAPASIGWNASDYDLYGYDLNGIQLKLRRYNGTDQSDLIVELYATANNRPDGFPVTTAIVPATRIETDWTIVDVPLFICDGGGNWITAGKKYAIVLSQRHSQASRYEWATANVSSSLQFGKWNGSSWVDESLLGDGWLRVSLIGPVSRIN